MKVPSPVWVVVALLSAGGVGYHLAAERKDSGSWLALERTPPLEYYATQESFSEVENTKSSLEALCLRFRTAVRAKRVADREANVRSCGAGAASEPHLDSAIADLEQGMSEFAGTDQELDVAEDLLLALKMAKQFDRWVDVYLKALYEHPTHRVVARLARDAASIANQCGREQNVLAGLLYMRSIPMEFQGNSRREAAHLPAGNQSALASHDQQNLQSCRD